AFADRKHAGGQWRTRRLACSWRPLRVLASCISFKRYGVDLLARSVPEGGIAIDVGAGQGAYAHWFSTVRRAAVVAVDHSFEALRRIPPARRGTILRVCADGRSLPLKSECAHALYTVDTLGHLSRVEKVLDEMLRVTQPGASLFIHSECADYRDRWPDRMLIKRLHSDLPARLDGHVSLLSSADLRALAARRFTITRAWSPAGLTGWLTGYPEKYRPAFSEAHCRSLALLVAVFALIKRTPVAGFLLRLLNASLNHLELALGLQGGGSLFMVLSKPVADNDGHPPQRNPL
ncbi:MAG: class I SAM-dependent methyltransferase, partial [Chitinispirillaceae bacterium]|nr:class I SAM-dependent methyltransferase [Chitinispirillaceae bacterium]